MNKKWKMKTRIEKDKNKNKNKTKIPTYLFYLKYTYKANSD